MRRYSKPKNEKLPPFATSTIRLFSSLISTPSPREFVFPPPSSASHGADGSRSISADRPQNVHIGRRCISRAEIQTAPLQYCPRKMEHVIGPHGTAKVSEAMAASFVSVF